MYWTCDVRNRFTLHFVLYVLEFFDTVLCCACGGVYLTTLRHICASIYVPVLCLA